jgi:hypothetical protein
LEGKSPDAIVAFEVFRVNYDLIETLDMQMAKGRSFSKLFGKEASNIIFNEAAIAAM